MKYYSKSTNSFYDDRIHIKKPADAVAISDAQHAALMQAQETGKVIQADAKGIPVAAERIFTTEEQVQMLVTQARASLSQSDLAIVEPISAEWAAYRNALRAIILGKTTPATLPAPPASDA